MRAGLFVCLNGAFHCASACLPALRVAEAASIVNIDRMTGTPAPRGGRTW